ncbi:hypothetical protein Mapa_006246 [Marchantia paleacea]|nr:hypothetical protein Mapa_006246 [Marchantia paleacea]
MMGQPGAQPPSRSKSGSKLEPKPKHRLTGSVSSLSYTPEELSSADAPGNGNPTSGGSSSALPRDSRYRRRTRSSLGGTEDLIKELDFLTPSSKNPDSRESTPTPPTTPPAGVRLGTSPAPGTEYPALKAEPSNPVEDSARTSSLILSTTDFSSDKDSVSSEPKGVLAEGSKELTPEGTAVKAVASVRPAVSYPDVVALETQGGSAVQLKAGAYSTNEEEDLWICRQCGWTYPNAHPSAKHRRNHKKVCGKVYPGVEVPPGSSDDASSDDEKSEVEQAAQAPTTTFSATTLPAPDKADAKDEPVKKTGVAPKVFTKPTIATGSESSSKNSPVTSPGKRDSPFSSPAKRESFLSSPAKKETPWGSPIKRSTPVNSPSKRVSSPITSPVKRINSTPVKKYSPPRPEKQEGVTRILTAKQQQEEEERKISVKKRIEDLERIAGGKPHTWKDYLAEGKKSGELSSSGSPLRHVEDGGSKSGELSPSGKPLKHVEAGGRKSADFSHPVISGKPLRHIQSARKSGELPPTGGSPPMHSDDGKTSKTPEVGEISEARSASSEDRKSAVEEPSSISSAESANVNGGKVATQGSVGTETKKRLDFEEEMLESAGHLAKVDVGNENTSRKDAVTIVPLEKVTDAVAILSLEKALDADVVIVTGDSKVAGEGIIGSHGQGPLEIPLEKGLSKDNWSKLEAGAPSHSRSPSFVLEKGDPSLGTDSIVPQDQDVLRPSLVTDNIDAGTVLKEVVIPDKSPAAEGVSPIISDKQGDTTPTENANVKEELKLDSRAVVTSKEHPVPVNAVDTSLAKEQPSSVVTVDDSLAKEQSSSAVVAPVAVTELVQDEVSSKTGVDSSDNLSTAAKSGEKAEVSVLGVENASPSGDANSQAVSVKSVAEEPPAPKFPTERSTVKSPESDNAVGNVPPCSRPVDQEDDTSVLLTKQPAVDPLFVDSQQDRLWEMHSQELTRREGETSGTDVRESSAQDDDPIQYVNGSPMAAEASASGTTSNGNGHSEKGSKVDRPRTPLRSLIAEDDAADKGGDDGAPTGKETPIVSPRGNLFRRIVSGGKASPTKPSTPSMFEKKSHSKPFLSSCICCSPVK